MQAQYSSQILKLIRDFPGISRVRLAKELDLDRSSITNLIASLMEHGLLRHRDGSLSGERGGRRQIPLELNPDYGIVIGIEIQSDSYVTVFTNVNGNLLFMQKEMIQINGANLERIIDQAVGKWQQEACDRGYLLLGVGIGVTGVVDVDNGIIIRSQPLSIYERLSVLDNIRKKYSFPILLDNDTNCCCWGVLAFSPDRTIRNFLYVLVELEEESFYKSQYKRMGTGWGFALNGKVYYGDSGSAGEFKSFLCRAHDEDQFSINYNTRLLMKTDIDIRESFLRELARNIAFTVNVLNLSHVFLGGGIEGMSIRLTELIHEEVRINWLYDWDVDLTLIFSKTGDFPAAIGAAGLAAEKLFEVPFMQISRIISEVYSSGPI